MNRFTLEYWEEDGWFVGRLLEVPGVFSQGETLDELKENIEDAYSLMIETEPLEFLPASRSTASNSLTLAVLPLGRGSATSSKSMSESG